MKELNVDLAYKDYKIYIGDDLLSDIASFIKPIFHGEKIVIITDDNLNRLYGDKTVKLLEENYDVSVFSFPHGEQSKTMDTALSAIDFLLDKKISRSDLIIALGGGVVGDLAGFVASIYLRGIPFVQVPTSLLAQVDSSVGGKVAVDLPQGKNLVGSFYHPKLVLIDTKLLDTLPEKFFNDGLGEVIKYGLIKDEDLFNKLKSYENKDELKKDMIDIIYTCCAIKREIVEQDELDKGERMVLNFGHTLGHALEKTFGYDKFTHGEGVCVGMHLITKVSEHKGLTLKGSTNEIKNILKKYDLPLDVHLDDKQQIIEAMKLDKKNLDGALNVILIDKVGSSFIYKTDTSFFNEIF